jgi:hypothetical protein
VRNAEHHSPIRFGRENGRSSGLRPHLHTGISPGNIH